MPALTTKIMRITLPLAVLLLTACGGGGLDAQREPGSAVGAVTPDSYTIGGTVSGLTGSVVLQNNGGDSLTVSANGSFTFATKVNNNGTYAVTILTQPTGQTCTVSAGAGTVSGGNVTGIVLVCTTNTFEVVVDTGATGGGTWSGTNPDVFTSNASAATVSVADIQSRLNAGIPVTIATSAVLGNGDIFVNSAVSWSANKVTLTAHRNIEINANLNGSGTASLALEYAQGGAGDYYIKNGAKVSLPAGLNFSTKNGAAAAIDWTVITSLGVEGDATVAPGVMTLQGMNTGLAGNYALGADIAASGTSTWNANAGFTPVGNNITKFTGNFAGLGHTITGLTINRLATNYVGLFGYATGTLRDVGLLNSNISGWYVTGSLAGRSDGAVSYSSADGGSVSGDANLAGGLVGQNAGSVDYSYANVSVTGNNNGISSTAIGGLVGANNGSISNSYATGSVHGGTDVGGLAGQVAAGAAVTNAYSTGAVTWTSGGGGLIGWKNATGTVTNSFWDATTSGVLGSAAGTGKTTAEMKTQATFAGWDFVGKWKIVEGVSYPTLR